MAEKQVKAGRSEPFSSLLLAKLRTFLSAVFITVAILLLLLAAGEAFVFLIDVAKYGSDTYVDWFRTPLIMLSLAFVSLLLCLLMNVHRTSWYPKLKEKLKITRPPKDIEPIELD